ncbi:MAG: DUF2145 domain-containing protein [Deltaproteobacteria bacterium]|nr:DUF2145 domain-containing protein [Deltaproteobacteria bacterium]
MRHAHFLVVLCLFLMTLTSSPARAGRSCEEKPPTPVDIQKGLHLALKTKQVLMQSDATLALLGRVGSDLSAYGLRYSHAGFVWRDHPKGQWLVIHALNRCATATSAVFDEGLGNFFLDDPFAYEVLVVIPSRETQEKLAWLLASTLSEQLHQATYNMLAYPWSTRYQNSNQWLLELLAAAIAPAAHINSRTQAQQWLRQQGYRPSEVKVPALQRLGARLFSANIQFDDHPFADRIAGQYQVVTVESVVGFLQRVDPHTTRQVIRLD